MSISTNGARTDFANAQIHSSSQNNTSPESVAVNLEPQTSQESPVQPAGSSVEPHKQGTDPATVTKNVKQANKMLAEMNQPYEYRLVREKGTDVLQLFDKDNKKVIYQTPPEGLVEAAAKLPQMIKGLLIDTKQ